MERLRARAARLGGVFAGSVRHKLLALVLAPLLLGVPALLLIVWAWGTQGYDRMMINKVSADLGAAAEFFDRLQSDFDGRLLGLARSHALVGAVLAGDGARAAGLLASARAAQGLDYLLLLDRSGRVVTGHPASARAARGGREVVARALSGQGAHGLEVWNPAQLSALSPDLAARAHLDLRPSPLASPTDRQAEDRGLMLIAALPVTDDDGAVLAVLEAGVLLNGNLDITDRLNGLVYQGASLPSGSEGAATLFLGDVRVSTSIRLPDGQRALGTRVSQAVFDRVLRDGQPWMGRAPVVGQDYISGYMPLDDIGGHRVGMLYVGFLERPLRAALLNAMAGIVLAFLVVSVLGLAASLRAARTIFVPLERMARVIQDVEDEDYAARVGSVASRDELGQLAGAFDRLLDSLAARRAELRRWAGELDAKVAERTALLEAAHTRLKQAQRHLVMTEKLSAIGELTAGVAHEINNPVAVMQGNLDLIKEVLGGDLAPVEDEIRLIDEQISRIQVIVNKLLQFARPGDYAGGSEDVDVNAAIADCLVLTRPNMRRRAIIIETHLQAGGRVRINRVELQQVLINLIVNALQSMNEGGTLTLSSRDLAGDEAEAAAIDGAAGVAVTVGDTGSGIDPAVLGRIFDPFFTTKKHKGTGLGLSISYAILKHYGASISVDSQPGAGTRFTIALRRHAPDGGNDPAPAFSHRFGASLIAGDDGQDGAGAPARVIPSGGPPSAS